MQKIKKTYNGLNLGDDVVYETLFDTSIGGPHFIPGRIVEIKKDGRLVIIEQASGARIQVDAEWCEKQ